MSGGKSDCGQTDLSLIKLTHFGLTTIYYILNIVKFKNIILIIVCLPLLQALLISYYRSKAGSLLVDSHIALIF